MSPFDCPRRVEDAKVRARVVALLKERRVRLPTFAELADPAFGDEPGVRALATVGPDAPDAANLARVHWFNDWDRRGRRPVPAYLEIPSELSGVAARIVVAIGDLFPMIGAHKVLAAYACLAPRLAAGRFDPTRQ
ncbi:MAG TPA: pyridoxal-5'-phosphate-dependent protein subunit beta, partial [Hyphomicrobiaceae bacterium]|nr:pyridoxal-5'-phosphate-dependent protein subunit beta [Hyphomicrobiaceae bacterium]